MVKRATVAWVLILGNVVVRATEIRAPLLGILGNFNEVIEGDLGPASDLCNTMDDDGPGLTSEGRDGVGSEIQGPSGGGRDRMCSGGLASSQ